MEIMRRYPQIDITYLSNKSDEVPDDLVIILCGCHSECFDYSDMQGVHGQIALFGPEDFYKIERIMNQLTGVKMSITS
jgi:hypothetical protein